MEYPILIGALWRAIEGGVFDEVVSILGAIRRLEGL